MPISIYHRRRGRVHRGALIESCVASRAHTEVCLPFYFSRKLRWAAMLSSPSATGRWWAAAQVAPKALRPSMHHGRGEMICEAR